MSFHSFSLLQLSQTPEHVKTVMNTCSMKHDDDDVMELQQLFAEAKDVIQHLAGQVDHYSSMQHQLAGLPT